MIPHPPPPSPGLELLDDLDAPAPFVERSLQNIVRCNTWFGGRTAARAGLREAFQSIPPGPASLLDLGAGAGDLGLMAIRWAARRGIRLQVIGLERHPVVARIGARAGLPMVLATGLALPFPDGGLDIVLLSQVLHHFDETEATAMLRECARVARHAVIVADLVPSRAAEWAFGVASRLLRFDPWTRADGRLSLRRGFRRPRLTRTFHAAGLMDVHVRQVPFARIVAVGRCSS